LQVDDDFLAGNNLTFMSNTIIVLDRSRNHSCCICVWKKCW